MKTILIPVDFSEHTTSTYKFAIRIAGTSSAQLTFLHSYNDQLMIPDSGLNAGFDNGAFANIQIIEEFKQLAEINMKKLVENANSFLENNKLNEIQIDSIVTGGEPELEITRICNDIVPNFIVMGTQGSGKKGILEGSMAKKIMNKAKVPVIAVPSGKHNYKDLKIMYACNDCEKDSDKIHKLLKMFGDTPATIYAVHFLFDANNNNYADHISELQENFLRERSNNLVNFSLIDADNTDDALDAFVNLNNINMVAFIAHKSNLLKWLFRSKITKHDFFKLDLPMIAFHE